MILELSYKLRWFMRIREEIKNKFGLWLSLLVFYYYYWYIYQGSWSKREVHSIKLSFGLIIAIFKDLVEMLKQIACLRHFSSKKLVKGTDIIRNSPSIMLS